MRGVLAEDSDSRVREVASLSDTYLRRSADALPSRSVISNVLRTFHQTTLFAEDDCSRSIRDHGSGLISAGYEGDNHRSNSFWQHWPCLDDTLKVGVGVHRILHRIGARHVFFRGNSC
jgi:hypothetical protein